MQELIEAVRAGDEGRVRAPLAEGGTRGAARDESGVSALLLARYHGHEQVAETLRSGRSRLDLFEAAAFGDRAAAETALDADPAAARAFSADGFTALHLAAFFGQPELAELLLGRGADPSAVARNPMRVQPLHSAAASRQLAIARALLDAGADVDARQEGGFTALHAAAHNGDVALVRLLLERGADVSLALDDGRDAAALARES